MDMAHEQDTQHALLIPWGHFAREIGLLSGIEAVKLSQKVYEHTPQAKVIEFLVAILSGAKYLQDISQAAHPLDKDVAVAEAWGQAGWADYTGVSRTLSALSWAEVHEIVNVLEQVSQPLLDRELSVLRSQGCQLQYDGDLTGLPVSNTSRTYPNAAYGHMSDEIRLGYQAGVVSLQSLAYGRLWLAVEHHAGDTVSCTQAEALVLAAEKRSGQRPRRRTELLQQRIEAFIQSRTPAEKRLASQRTALAAAQSAKQETLAQLRAETNPKRISVLERRCVRREKAVEVATKKLDKTQVWLNGHLEQEKALRQRLEQFEQENAENPQPLEACFRLDAGFGTYDNIALLIEMGYEVYVKLHNHKIVQMLQKKVTSETTWMRVGNNAEMVAWAGLQLQHCPYPLDIALERFYTGQTQKHSALAHFGPTPVTTDLIAWFGKYNARQTIEAGIKETKQVFYLNRLKVRSEPAIFLQEAMTIFAANFIRWATVWIDHHAEQDENTLPLGKMGIKKQVQVAAHTSAKVIQNSDGMLLRFSPVSAFAGKQLFFPASTRVLRQNCFSSFFTILALIAQKLR
jgi:flagellar hook-length control protein FliK